MLPLPPIHEFWKFPAEKRNVHKDSEKGYLTVVAKIIAIIMMEPIKEHLGNVIDNLDHSALITATPLESLWNNRKTLDLLCIDFEQAGSISEILYAEGTFRRNQQLLSE